MANDYDVTSMHLLSHNDKAAKLGLMGETIIPYYMTWYDPQTGQGFCHSASTSDILDDLCIRELVQVIIAREGLTLRIDDESLLTMFKDIHQLAPDIVNQAMLTAAEYVLDESGAGEYDIGDMIRIFKEENNSDLRGVAIHGGYYCDKDRYASSGGYASLSSDRVVMARSTGALIQRAVAVDKALVANDIKMAAKAFTGPFVREFIGIKDRTQQHQMILESMAEVAEGNRRLFGLPFDYVTNYVAYELMEQENDLSTDVMVCEIPDD